MTADRTFIFAKIFPFNHYVLLPPSLIYVKRVRPLGSFKCLDRDSN
jgi:hypothetical protein